MDFGSYGHDSGTEDGGETQNQQSQGGSTAAAPPSGRKRARAHPMPPAPLNVSFKDSFRQKGNQLSLNRHALRYHSRLLDGLGELKGFLLFIQRGESILNWKPKGVAVVRRTWTLSDACRKDELSLFEPEAFSVVVKMLIDPPKLIVRFLRGQVLPGQIGILYALWSLYESQLHCPHVPVRLDPSAMAELLQLRRRLQQTQHVLLAREALALLKRFLAGGRIVPTVSHPPPPRGHAELAYLWGENLKRRDKHYGKRFNLSAWQQSLQQRKHLVQLGVQRKTFASDSEEEGMATDGDDEFSSMGKNIQSMEHSNVRCTLPDDFDKRIEELRVKTPLITPMDVITLILEHFRLDETANAYSRAHSGPPSQLLKKDSTTASAVKSSQQHDRLQLVLKDLELLEETTPIDPYGIEQYNAGAHAVVSFLIALNDEDNAKSFVCITTVRSKVELPKPVPFWPPLGASVVAPLQQEMEPPISCVQQQDLQPSDGGGGEDKGDTRGPVTYGSVAARLHLKRLHEGSTGPLSSPLSKSPVHLVKDHLLSPSNEVESPSVSLPQIGGAAGGGAEGQGSSSNGNILAKKKKPSNWSAGNILARRRPNV